MGDAVQRLWQNPRARSRGSPFGVSPPLTAHLFQHLRALFLRPAVVRPSSLRSWDSSRAITRTSYWRSRLTTGGLISSLPGSTARFTLASTSRRTWSPFAFRRISSMRSWALLRISSHTPGRCRRETCSTIVYQLPPPRREHLQMGTRERRRVGGDRGQRLAGSGR